MAADLAVRDLEVSYGSIRAIQGVSLDVPTGEMVALIGANGAGKSTLLRTLVGLKRASSGSARYDGRELLGQPVHRIARSGVCMVPEGRRVFPRLTVKENLLLGGWGRSDHEARMEQVFDRFPVLRERQGQSALTLSGGEQQMLAVGRALMQAPSILLLDEPSMGLSPALTATVFRLLREIHESGVTMLVVEQNARMALRAATHAYVLERGRVVLSGTAEELLASAAVKAAYLGVD